jgi:ABC-2 type transport system ATP-binding protein
MQAVLTPSGPTAALDTAHAALVLRGLTKRFGKGAHALTAVDHISLAVPYGQVFGLLGPNGAGKTTTIKMMTGLVIPTKGTALVGGYDIGRQRGDAVWQIGAVLEGSRNVYWSLSAWQNLHYFGRLKGLHGAQIRPRAEQLLRELGLWERRHQAVGGFSRGMQQKVAIAAALISDPPIVLLDEPTIGLDVEAARTVRQWIVRLAREEGKTVVLTTHQLAMAEELCDRVAVMRADRIVADLPARELLDRYVEDRFAVQVAASDATPLEPLLSAEASLTHVDGNVSIELSSPDQQQLHTLLTGLHERKVPLVSVTRVKPSLEEVFVKLVRGESRCRLLACCRGPISGPPRAFVSSVTRHCCTRW